MATKQQSTAKEEGLSDDIDYFTELKKRENDNNGH